jgi:hypothetical protein
MKGNIRTEIASLAIKVDDLREHPDNVRQGDVGAISESLTFHGQYRPIVVQRSTNYVLAGNHTLKAARSLGWSEVAATFVDCNDEQALRILLIDNRTNDLASYDEPALIDALKQLTATDQGLLGTAFDPSALDEMIAALGLDDPEPMIPNSRTLPLDMIFTQTLLGLCCVSVACGLKYGKQSGKEVCGNYHVHKRHTLTFLDNDWHDYRHDKHVAEAALYRPKYVTTRDLVTKEQAKRFGVEYQSIEQTIEQADELGEHAENVILIPKYDCIDQLPDRFMLGYSIPTSHGGTPLPIERFAGRRVHLLGGSWKKQMAYLSAMKDDVVSIDNNYLSSEARWGAFTYPDGRTATVRDLGITNEPYKDHCPLFIAAIISINSIANAMKLIYDDGYQLEIADADVAPRD